MIARHGSAGGLHHDSIDVCFGRVRGIEFRRLGAGPRFRPRFCLGLDAAAWSTDHGDLARHAAGRERQHAAPSECECQGARTMAGRPYIRLTNVSTPTITLYKPTGKNTGAAVVVFPGGGYQILSIDLEGTEVCDWLNSDRRDLRAAEVSRARQRAVSEVRGGLAGCAARDGPGAAACGGVGHRSAPRGRAGLFSRRASCRRPSATIYDKRVYDPVDAADKLSCRPDFAVVVYPGYLALAEQNFAPNPDIHPTADTPPTFIVQAEDDPVHVENAVVYFHGAEECQGARRAAHLRAGRTWLRAAAAETCPSWAGRNWWRPGCTPSKCCRQSRRLESPHAACRPHHLRPLLARADDRHGRAGRGGVAHARVAAGGDPARRCLQTMKTRLPRRWKI